MSIMHTKDISISYGNKDIVSNLNLTLLTGKITSIIGSNGCGKSTILKTLSRLLKPKNGMVYLDGKEITSYPDLEIAKKMAILPQSPQAPNGLLVKELVAYGRYPHQKGFGSLNAHDYEKIDWALQITNMAQYQDRSIDALSGGQRQRVWIAMALAQDTDLILLDEPTTYLDMVHQLEILKLLKKLNVEQHRTIVMVIHDINMAARFSDHLITIKDGKILKEGTPSEIMTPEVLKEVFSIDALIGEDPRTKKPICISYDNL